MKKIIELEIKNLSKEDKKELIEFINEFGYKKIDPKNSDKELEAYFQDYPTEFIAFQKRNKNSLYNQAIKENNFKDLTYKDMVENLTQEQKDKIVRDISSMVKYLKKGQIFKIKKDENGNYFYEDSSLENFTNKDRENIEKIEDMSEEQK
ncbi:hypothetical protein [Mesomycoplasma ovipneumoniae]|uniref:hypothetical protein n=1 Tax=Mesomycoplasma ovipneumoniae TaxID=29562 RepID=UPI00083E7409|nr:hypothetical protein [Mesomycoplasma ovipneumoniae]